jgi:hypothetical protein
MKRILLLCSALILFATTVVAQKDQKEKPWTEWTEKEVTKILTDSAWAQSQSEFSETNAGTTITTTQPRNAASLGNAEKTESGENLGKKDAALSTIYRVGFLTSKPMRAAFIRRMELRQPETPPATVAERRTWVDKDFGDYIVVYLVMDGTDQKKVKPINQMLTSSNKDTFKDIVYLERKDGKRVSLTEYYPPKPDGMGAKFIFPRTLDGKPFLDASSGEVRVYMEINKTKLSRKFKVADMMYGGKLEY